MHYAGIYFRGFHYFKSFTVRPNFKVTREMFLFKFHSIFFKNSKIESKMKKDDEPDENLSRNSVERSKSFQFLNFESNFFNLSRGINIRGFELGNIFAGSNFRDFAEKP